MSQKILSSTGEKLLMDACTVIHKKAMSKVEEEYKKYSNKTLCPVEQDYLNYLKELEDLTK